MQDFYDLRNSPPEFVCYGKVRTEYKLVCFASFGYILIK